MRWASRFIRLTALVALSAFVLGGVTFAHLVTRQPGAVDAGSAEAVIALTGGGGARIRAALEQVNLVDGQCDRRLLISGVNPDTSMDDLRSLANGRDLVFERCVDARYTATTTRGNAIEIADWTNENGYTAVLIVTSDFHMPRSLLEIRARAPQLTLIPYPVASTTTGVPWWRDPNAVRRLSVEYVKYLVIQVRPPQASGEAE